MEIETKMHALQFISFFVLLCFVFLRYQLLKFN